MGIPVGLYFEEELWKALLHQKVGSGGFIHNNSGPWSIPTGMVVCWVEWPSKNRSSNVPVDCSLHLPCEIIPPFSLKKSWLIPVREENKNWGQAEMCFFHFQTFHRKPFSLHVFLIFPNLSCYSFFSNVEWLYLVEKYGKHNKTFWAQEWKRQFFFLIFEVHRKHIQMFPHPSWVCTQETVSLSISLVRLASEFAQLQHSIYHISKSSGPLFSKLDHYSGLDQ